MTNESIIDAIEANLLEYIRIFAKHEKNEYFEDDEVLRYVSDINIPSMHSNSVYKNRFLNSSCVDDAIKEVLKPFKEKGVPLFFTVGPSSEPKSLSAHLKKNGLSWVQTQKGMAIDLYLVEDCLSIPDEIEIREVRSVDELKEFLKINTIGFNYSKSLAEFVCESYQDILLNEEVSGVHYVAYLNGKPVATSSLFVTGEIAGLYNVITIPEARRRGIGKMMTLIPLIKAKELGCKLGILQATDAGAHVYRKIGFREYCVFELYMKLYGSSIVSFPFSYLGMKLTNQVRRCLVRV